MTTEENKLLTDIKEAILSIDEHLEGRRISAEYEQNKTKPRAVECELIKINYESYLCGPT